MTGPGSSCGACKFLRRKCTSECVFAPYFCYDLAASHFAAVHKVFGASNVSKLLLHLPVHNRNDAAISIAYEALARMQDPVYGCVAHIFSLQQQVVNLQEEIDSLLSQMPNLGTGVDPSGGDFQAAAALSTEKSQLSMQRDIMSSVYHQEEQAALPNNPVVTAAINQTPGNQMNEVYKWQEESFVSDTVANLAGVGFDAADLGIEGFMWTGNETNVGGSWVDGPGWW